MKEVIYSIVKKTNTERILQLYRQAGWWEPGDDPRYLITVARIIEDTYCFVIAKLEGEIVGMGRAISDGCSDAYIQDVTVDSIHRGKGIGKGIVRKLVQHLTENKLQWIGLISEPGYEKFYGSLGFEVMQSYTPFILKQPRD
ncbi:MAG TPA: GNAT family N-acetyltransferase [Candidatus Cloacimonadota bacterium]|nr:GNAT family N-acetyltransferase [Candidatus Cloacimonadota bacterium]HPS39263.1 GNAT family N-acetyltransferase [Candidatus Cloacimonadota bacterium]